MKPAWTYTLKKVAGKEVYWLVRNDNKRFGPMFHVEHARRVAARFTAYANNPWGSDVQ